MANKTQQIRIESILGGMAPISFMPTENQFRYAIGIDPSATDDGSGGDYGVGTGLLVPTNYADVAKELQVVTWIQNAPKTTSTFFYGASGSCYTRTGNDIWQGGLSDGGTMSGTSHATGNGASSGNGFAYYDNYMYLAKNTTIARYGPLDGDAVFDGDYWGTTLAKAELTDTTYPYPASYSFGGRLPNHILHRHSNGKLYIADVVGNNGTLHSISTTKTTREGDTDNGSKVNELTFGYGLWPTAIESYGDSVVIALYEGKPNIDGSAQMSAKIAFWDTTSLRANSIMFVEFPDTLITAMKNINGVLYFFSTNPYGVGFRVSRYLGGSSIEEIGFYNNGASPMPGAVDGGSNRLIFGSIDTFNTSDGCVYSYGLANASYGNGLFITGAVTTTSTSVVTALKLSTRYSIKTQPVIAWSGNGVLGTVAYESSSSGRTTRKFHSNIYRIGQPFKITKVRIPLLQNLAGDMTITPTLYFDNSARSHTLKPINLTNYGGNTKTVVIRPDTTSNCSGDNDFYLEIVWSGANCTVSLPIVIDYELLDIDTTYP
jgi:hypothetical protein